MAAYALIAGVAPRERDTGYPFIATLLVDKSAPLQIPTILGSDEPCVRASAMHHVENWPMGRGRHIIGKLLRPLMAGAGAGAGAGAALDARVNR
ncbi:uncharacterized protein BROUX77_001148 [Berkeleyomyces rouxiae]|uniref:uncharacterized protein n=1 Tax=Berkeleyomyces rouxiae TaxID=2035830 RepID=UPI003B7FCF08